VDVCLVEDAGALGLWEDEVEEECEADPGVEWDPAEVRILGIRSREGMRTKREQSRSMIQKAMRRPGRPSTSAMVSIARDQSS
jgi:hypothetical protein